MLNSKYPSSKKILDQSYKIPLQINTNTEPFTKIFYEQIYQIYPLQKYEIQGLIVSSSDHDENWLNFNFERDPAMLRDLCIVWGGNLVNNNYQNYEFWSNSTVCWYRNKPNIATPLINEAYSNNHLVPANDYIHDRIKDAEIGDQIYIKGYLVDYRKTKGNFLRTSTSRHDKGLAGNRKGSGACEIIYVEEFIILQKHNAHWRFLKNIFWFVIGVFLFLLLVLKLSFTSQSTN